MRPCLVFAVVLISACGDDSEVDPQLLGFRVASVSDAVGTTFRYRAIALRRDGTSIEFFDAGEIDADGRIATLLVFAGPLVDVTG